MFHNGSNTAMMGQTTVPNRFANNMNRRRPRESIEGERSGTGVSAHFLNQTGTSRLTVTVNER